VEGGQDSHAKFDGTWRIEIQAESFSKSDIDPFGVKLILRKPLRTTVHGVAGKFKGFERWETSPFTTYQATGMIMLSSQQ
jgi:hypothetical protein